MNYNTINNDSRMKFKEMDGKEKITIKNGYLEFKFIAGPLVDN